MIPAGLSWARSAVPFLVAAALLAPSPAGATCMTNCAASLVFPSCDAPIPADEWPASKPLSFAAECETCCAPPDGPVDCSPAPAEGQGWSLWKEGTEVAGKFGKLPDACEEKAVLSFEPKLAPGAYELHAANVILVFFQVKVAGGCTTDADCSGCDECADGVCGPPCAATCKTDPDCGPDAECIETVPGCCTECQPKPPMPDAVEPADVATLPEVEADAVQPADVATGEEAANPVPEAIPEAGPDASAPDAATPDPPEPEVATPAPDPGVVDPGSAPTAGKGGSGCTAGASASSAWLVLVVLFATFASRRRGA